MAVTGRATRLRSLVRGRASSEERVGPRPVGRAAYIVGGTWRRGGTRIALRVAELLQERFGFELRLVQGRHEKAPNLITVAELRREALPYDIVICNPSFSDHQLGLSCPARVVTYIQSVNAYRAIDGFCDLYVASSSFVRDHLALHYDMTPKIIPPFVDLDAMPTPLPFRDRRPGTAIVYPKIYGDVLVAALRERLTDRAIDLDLVRPERLAHDEYLRTLGAHRFCICLSPLEGFALVPLEALAMGTVPLGFHGNGALDYLDAVIGRGLTRYPDLDGVVDRIEWFVADTVAAEGVSNAGPRAAAPYRREIFDQRWTDELSRFLGEAPATEE